MNFLLVLLLSFSAFAQSKPANLEKPEAIVTSGVSEISENLAKKHAKYRSVRHAQFSSWGPDGKGILIRTRFGETMQVHYVKVPLGQRKQLTFFDEPVGSAQVCPAEQPSKGFFYHRDEGGSENYQIYQYILASGESRLVTDGKSKNGGVVCPKAGNKFAYSSTRRNGKSWDVYVQDPEKPLSAELVYLSVSSSKWSPTDFSQDGRFLLIHEYVSSDESHLHVLNLETKKIQPLFAANEKEKVSYGNVIWGKGKNQNRIYYLSDEEGEFRGLFEIDPDVKEKKSLTADIDWNVEEFDVSPDGQWIVFTVNENGVSQVYLQSLSQKKRKKYKREKIDLAMNGIIYGLTFHPTENRVAFGVSSSRNAGSVFEWNQDSKKLVRWTDSELGGLDPQTFSVPEIVSFRTFDKDKRGKRRKISALAYRPQNRKKGEKFPVLIRIHGGPASQYRPYFSTVNQFYVAEFRTAVLAPNVRGSYGFGKSFLKLDDGRKRENSVKDIGALLDWIRTQPDLDSSRVAVTGGSYGGYMALASMIHFGNRLRCGRSFVGISNFVTFLESTKAYRRDLRRSEYGDERDPEMRKFLQSISPLTNARKIRKPLLVIQGQNDPRVPATESEQIVEAVRKNDVDVWYILAKNEGHGFRKKKNVDFQSLVTAKFFQSCLLKK